jgi:predicted ATP-binding protein involved in virulence
MELLYLWIEDYKNIHHQGFNFSSEYRFAFTPTEFETVTETNGEEGKTVKAGNLEVKDIYPELKEEEKPFYNFFEPSEEVIRAWKKNHLNSDEKLGTITNVTAIVGANGAGKSNLLEFIKKEIREKISKIPRIGKVHPFIYVMRENNSNIFCSGERIEIKINSLNKTKVLVLEEFPEKKKLDQTFVFYSNQLNTFRNEGSSEASGPGKLISVSLSNGLLEAKGIFQKYNTINLENHLKFLRDNTSKAFNIILPFNPPEYLEIKIQLDYIPSNIDNSQRISFDKLKWEYIRLTLNPPAEITKFDLIIKFLKIKRIHKILDLIQSNYEKRDDTNPIDSPSFVDILEFEERIKRFLNLNTHQKYANARLILDDNQLFQSSYLNFFEKYFKEELQQKITYPQSNLEEEPIAITEISFIPRLDDFNKFLYLIENSEYDFFNFSWVGLSSGEEAMLSIYSKFYQTLFDPLGGESMFTKRRNLYLLIDEGEVGFHPEWQRKYLKYLIDFLPQIYAPANIQIILTTHSPFLASDLPKENIIFLQKAEPKTKEEKFEIVDGIQYERGKCIVVDGLKKDKTFGANIHTLLSDSFFLQEGLMGEFAKRKIKQITDFYKEVKIIEETLNKERVLDKSKDDRFIGKEKEYKTKKDNFWNIQKIIGEEYLAQIIKNHLEDLDLFLLNQLSSNEDRIEQFLKQHDISSVEKVLNKFKNSSIEKKNDKD